MNNRLLTSSRNALYGLRIPVTIVVLFSCCLLVLTVYPTDAICLFMDTYNVYQGFHYSFQELCLNGRLPEWDPYLRYGQPTYVYDLIYHTPFHYLAILIGKLLALRNTYYPFLLVFCLEMSIFVFGMYALCRLFLTRNTAVFAAIAVASLTSIPISNMYTNFLGTYLLPLSLYFIFESFNRNKPSYLPIGLVVAMVFALGITTYWVGIYLFVYVLTVSVFLGCRFLLPGPSEEDLLSLISNRKSVGTTSLLLCCVAGAFAAGIIYLLLSSREYLSFSLSSGRDPVTLKNSLTTFLNYPEKEGFRNAIEAFLGGASVYPDWSNIFLTSVGVFFLTFSLLMYKRLVRNRYYVVAAVMFFVTLFLCWGPDTPVARIAYHFPAVAYFRHLAGLYTFPKMFGSVLVGFGVQCYASEAVGANASKQARTSGVLAGMLCIALSLAAAKWYLLGGGRAYHDIAHIKSSLVMIYLNLLILALLTVAVMRLRPKIVLATALVVVILQSLLYQGYYRYSCNSTTAIDRSRYCTVDRAPFEETRVQLPDHPRVNAWSAVNDQHGAGLASHSWLNADLCLPFGRVDFATTGVFDLFRTGYKDLPKVVGCGTAKIQLVHDHHELPLDDAVDDDFSHLLGKGIILEDRAGKVVMLQTEGKGYPDSETLAEQGITVKGFTANSIEMEVSSPGTDGSWLIYADAYHPRWTATIDSNSAAIWRANMAFKAVKVPYGNHSVRFEFGSPYRRTIYWACVLFGGLSVLFSLWWAIRCTGSVEEASMAGTDDPKESGARL